MQRIVRPSAQIDLDIKGGPDNATVQSVTDKQAALRWSIGGGVMVIGLDLLKRLAAVVKRASG